MIKMEDVDSEPSPKKRERLSIVSKDGIPETDEVTPEGLPEETDPEEIARLEVYYSQPILRKYFLECVLLLFNVGTALYLIPLNGFIIRKSCLYKFEYDEQTCDGIQKAQQDMKNAVFAYANIYNTMRDVVSHVPGGCAALVLGSYLTRYGFRSALSITLIGCILTCICQLLTVWFMDLPLVFNVLADVPGSLAGGPIVVNTAVYTNIALRVPDSLRLHRLTAMGFISGISALISALCGSALAKFFGIGLLLTFCAVLITIPTIIFILFFDDIDVPAENKKDSWRDAIWVSFRDGFRTALAIVSETRPERRRTQIICIIICSICSHIGPPAAGGSFGLVFVGSVLGRDEAFFSYYSGGSMLLILVFIFPMLWLSKQLRMSHEMIIIVGSAFFVLKFAMLALTEVFRLLFYIQIVVGLPFYLSTLSLKACINRVVDSTEVAVVMAMLSLSEKIMPIFGGVLGTAVFSVTKSSFPGCYYLILSFMYLIPTGLGIYLVLIQRWNKREKLLNGIE